MNVTNFSLIDFENGNTLQEAELDFLFNGIHTTFEGILFNLDRIPLLPDSFLGENKIPAVINNSLFSINADGDIVLVSKQSLDDSVAAAAASAATALSATASSATSANALTIGTGSKSFTLAQTGKAFVVRQFVTIANDASPATKWMNGVITAFDSGTGAMSVTVNNYQGAGSASAWTITSSAPINAAGYTGQPTEVAGTSQTMVSGGYYIFKNSAAPTTATLNPSPNDGEEITLDNATGRYDMSVDPGAKSIMGDAGAMTRCLKGCFKMKFNAAANEWRFV
jgi:hypothetical protein